MGAEGAVEEGRLSLVASYRKERSEAGEEWAAPALLRVSLISPSLKVSAWAVILIVAIKSSNQDQSKQM